MDKSSKKFEKNMSSRTESGMVGGCMAIKCAKSKKTGIRIHIEHLTKQYRLFRLNLKSFG